MTHQTSGMLSEADKRSIEELRSRLSDELKEVPTYSDDYSLLRWLIGWDYKIGGIAGYDKEGNVVLIQPMARSDPKSLLSTLRMSDMLTIGISECEGAMSLIRANEKRLKRKLGAVLICDLEGFSRELLWMPGMKCYMNLLYTLQDMYPDVIQKVFVIGAPTAVHLVYNMLYPVLAKENREKMEFLSSDWKEKLQEQISPDQLFENWGGACQASTPLGRIRMGGKVPKELRYNARSNPEERKLEELSTLSVSARGSKKVTVKVDQAGSRLKWFFRVSSGDINFSVVHNNGKVLRPAFLLSTEIVPEWGEVTCELPGKYILTFENHHGKLWSKEITFSVEVVAPDVS